MRPHLVVVPPLLFDHDLRLGPRAEPLQAQAFIAELAVEALHRAVLPRLPWLDQRRFDALFDNPPQHRPRDELRPVVRAQERRRPACAHQPRVDSSVTVRHFNCWPLAQRSNTKS